MSVSINLSNSTELHLIDAAVSKLLRAADVSVDRKSSVSGAPGSGSSIFFFYQNCDIKTPNNSKGKSQSLEIKLHKDVQLARRPSF